MTLERNNGLDTSRKHLHNIKVLMYHKVVEDINNKNVHWTYVSKKQFSNHLTLLNKWGFTPITFRDYIFFNEGKINLPQKPVIITFDDGYEVVYKTAFPIIKDMGWNAVVFAIGDQNIKTGIWDNEFDYGNGSLLNRHQLLKMHDSGFEIGSHSMTHRHLASQTSMDAWFEITRSKDELETILGTPVQTFCYPYGSVNEKLKQMVKEAGYNMGCGVYTGPPRFGTDIFDIRRITISNSTNTIQFALKLLTPFEYYEYFSSKIARRKSNSYPNVDFKINPPEPEITKKEGTHSIV